MHSRYDWKKFGHERARDANDRHHSVCDRHLSIDTIPRSKSVPLRGGRLARTRQPITPGWESSRCWWCGEGAATWEAAGGLSIEGFATGSGRLSRGCTQAFSYNVAPAPGDAEDEALRELSAAFPLPPGRAALSCT